MAMYQGKQVEVVRPAKQGDPGFKHDQSEQLIVKGEDGQERCVVKDQVQGHGQGQAAQAGSQGGQASRPDQQDQQGGQNKQGPQGQQGGRDR